MTIAKYRLTKDTIAAVRKSLPAKNRLQFELKKSHLTIQRWLNSNSEMLTTAHALAIIAEETGVAKKDLLEVVK